ncbi:MAG: extracellular solute-binding protein [Chloroflexi bacterium]|nr:MAG: extracellular solute-binding protein [Chloroflexota bacterium]
MSKKFKEELLRMRKFLTVAVLLAILVAAVPASLVGAAAPLGQGEDYTVQADDWLSKLADKFYGDVNAYWAIMSATNKANAEDPSYTKIENPDAIEVGAKLRIPSNDDAVAFMADFDPAEGDVSKLFASGAGGQLLVGNWWTSGGEFAGVNEVYKIYRQEYPDVELIHAGLAGGAGVNFKAANLNKLIAGDPYDTFQLHAGLEAELYDPETFLQPVDDILEEAGVLDVMPEDLKSLLKIRGNTYTVPLNIHRGNVMWTNTKVLADAGIEKAPETFDEFFAVCEDLKSKGVVPLGMGIADGFELAHTFEVVLAGTVGAEKDKGLWNGSVSWTDPEVATALENFSKVLDCTNDDRGTVGWVGGIDLVINDQAAFNIMGDWAYGEVIAKGALDRVTWNSPPGNQGMFFLVSDGFAITKDAPNPENARNFVKIITRKDAQENFNMNKGSICARTDCDYGVFPEDRRAYFESSAADFAVDAIIPMVTHGSGAIPSWQDQFGQIATQFASDRDVAAAQAALVLAAEDAGFPQ